MCIDSVRYPNMKTTLRIEMLELGKWKINNFVQATPA